jgi:hypothetical protein
MQETWKILRYQRHQTLGIERRVRTSIELQKRLNAERAAKAEALSKRTPGQPGRPLTELSQMSELCKVLETSLEDIDALAEQGTMHQREFAQNRALEKG